MYKAIRSETKWLERADCTAILQHTAGDKIKKIATLIFQLRFYDNIHSQK